MLLYFLIGIFFFLMFEVLFFEGGNVVFFVFFKILFGSFFEDCDFGNIFSNFFCFFDIFFMES